MMMNPDQFRRWAQTLGYSEATIKLIEHIRSSPPARRVASKRGNVIGEYPSRKMGHTVQFESRTVELKAIWSMEHDPHVLEYWRASSL